MAAEKRIPILALALVSACSRGDPASLREIELDAPEALAAARMMYRDNPATSGLRKRLVKAYYIEARSNDCVWFIYDPKVGFHDSEYIYCRGKGESDFRRL